jgi:hypothetical protein
MRVVNLSAQSLAALLAGIFVSLSVLAAPSTAEACTPANPGLYPVGNSTLFEQSIPTDGAWAFHGSAIYMPIDDVEATIEVRDETGSLVEGTVSFIKTSLTRHNNFGEISDYLIVWTPTSPLLPEHTYSVDVRAFRGQSNLNIPTIDEQTTFTTSDASSAPALATVLGQPTIRIFETPGDEECCRDSTLAGSCSLERCWPTRYTYLPTIDVEITFPDTPTDLQVYHVVKDRDGHFFETFWGDNGVQSLEYSFPEDAQGPFCLELQSFSLATSELLNSEEFCFQHDDLPDFTPREYDGEGRPATCDDPGPGADAGAFPDAGFGDAGHHDAGHHDAGSQDASTQDGGVEADIAETGRDAASPGDAASEDGGGAGPNAESDDSLTPSGGGCACRTGGASPAGFAGVLLFLIAIVSARGGLLYRRG